MKNYTRIACAKEIVNFPGETRPKNTTLLWWDEPGWMLGAHPAGQGENTTKGLWERQGQGETTQNYCHGQTRLHLGKLPSFAANYKCELGNEKMK